MDGDRAARAARVAKASPSCRPRPPPGGCCSTPAGRAARGFRRSGRRRAAAGATWRVELLDRCRRALERLRPHRDHRVVDRLAHAAPSVAARGVSIGRPIANTGVWILDAQRCSRCPIGVPGEICIGGDGVTLGYLDRPELTAERFVTDRASTARQRCSTAPATAAAGATTACSSTWAALDLQVKVRGYRIELGEIEARCDAAPGVGAQRGRHARRPAGRRAPRRLRRRRAGRDARPGRRCDRHLRAALPEYMVPQHFVRAGRDCRCCPTARSTARRCPRPSATRAATRPSALAPRNERERIGRWTRWSSVLEPAAASASHDDFFALGGHSLLAARLTTLLSREFERHGAAAHAVRGADRRAAGRGDRRRCDGSKAPRSAPIAHRADRAQRAADADAGAHPLHRRAAPGPLGLQRALGAPARAGRWTSTKFKARARARSCGASRSLRTAIGADPDRRAGRS